MDWTDATRELFERIQKLEPEIAMKIIGAIFLQENGERDMIRLAYAPDKHLENLVHKIKLQLGNLSTPPISAPLSSPITISNRPISDVPLNYIPFSPNGSNSFSPQTTYRVSSYWDHQLTPEQPVSSSEFVSLGNGEFFTDDFWPLNQAPAESQFFGFEDQVDHNSSGLGNFSGDFYCPDASYSNMNVRVNHNLSPSLPDFPVKKCRYFHSRGFCKNGSSCRFLHSPDNLSTSIGLVDLGSEDHLISPGSLEKLDIEITELLKTKRGTPVSIASLPMLYYEKYGRTLQAEGYLTESQRHGRAGYSLTKLLDRLKGIRLIIRPHGQHSVTLAEDTRYNQTYRNERNDAGQIVSGSRQVYMTFPAESTFTEEDVSNYFSSFGVVEDVRIPCQQNRMFGFVTFASANTARKVLGVGNPHFVCGSRVLVKPYKEKSKLVDRNCMEKYDHHGTHFHRNYSDIDSEFSSMGRCNPPRFWRRQLMEQEQAQALEMERCLSSLQLGGKHIHNRQYVDYVLDELNAPEAPSKTPSTECFHSLLKTINNSSANDDRLKDTDIDDSDQDSQEINLPDHL